MNNTTSLNDLFPALVITNVSYLRTPIYEPTPVTYVVPNSLYGYGPERATTFEEALEVLFRQTNHVDGSEWIADRRVRSMSVGDTVTFRLPGGARRDYVCEGLGWKEISRDEAAWLVATVAPRDFFGTFEATKAHAK